MNEFIKQVLHHSNNAMWNNGSWGVRDVRSKPGTMSVHATGRAVDLSYRGGERHPNASRKAALPFVELLCAHANDLGIEMVIDYFPAPYGRAWRCDRQAWKKYSKPTVSGVLFTGLLCEALVRRIAFTNCATTTTPHHYGNK